MKAIGGVAVGTLALASGIVWLRGKKSAYELGQDKVVEYQKGVAEIAPIACEGDFIVAEFYTGLELVRTKTIAGGDGICDFRYVKEQA